MFKCFSFSFYFKEFITYSLICLGLCKLILLQLGHWPNELSVRQWSGRPWFNPRSSHTKGSKNGT